MTSSQRHATYWRGYIAGSDRGRLFARLLTTGDSMKAVALVEEQPFGPAFARLAGSRADDAFDLELLEYRSLNPVSPLGGQLTLELAATGSAATGVWRTELGGSGECRLYAVKAWLPRWWLARATNGLRRYLRKRAPMLYLIALVAVAAAHLTGNLDLNYPGLLLLLLPAPYLFRTQLIELLYSFRVRRLGPLELEVQQAPQVDLLQVVTQQVQQYVGFLALDGFFVPRTKHLLRWLALQGGTVPRERFEDAARILGIPASNLPATLLALTSPGCVEATEVIISVTEFGWAYVRHLGQQNEQVPPR